MMFGIGMGDREPFDFWLVYKAIAEYYPIGIDRNNSHLYNEYEGIKRIEKVLIERIHNDKNHQTEWVAYWQRFGVEIGKPIEGTTYGQAPSFSSYIISKEERGQICDCFEEIHFCVSLIGPFYTIYTQFSTGIENGNGVKTCRAVNRIESSPNNQTKKYYDLLVSRIESKYPGYQFVPYSIFKTPVEGLMVHYRDEKQNRIYHALFNDFFQFGRPNIGDHHYRP
jgi:hypothetical protein